MPIVAGSLIGAFALGTILFTTRFPLLLFVSILYGVGFSMVTSSSPALVSELSDKALVGTSMGFLGAIMDVGQTLRPIITRFVLGTSLGYLGSFTALTAILLTTCGIFVTGGTARN